MTEDQWNEFRKFCDEAERDGNESVELWTADFRHLLDTIDAYDRMLRQAKTCVDPASRLGRQMQKALYADE